MATVGTSSVQTSHAAPAEPAVMPIGRLRQFRHVLVFVVISLLFGGFFAFAVPIAWGPDEPAQFDRAFQVAQGIVAPVRLLPNVDGLPRYGGSVPISAADVAAFYGPPKAVPQPYDRLFTSDPAFSEALTEPFNAPLVTVGFPNTSAYSPVPYLPAALGLKLASALGLTIGGAWRSARLAQMLAYTLVAAVGLVALRGSRFRWMALPLALLPTAIFQSAVISADGLTNAVAFTFLALIAKAVVLGPGSDGGGDADSSSPMTADGATHEPWLSRWESWLLLLGTVLLPLMKPTYVILSLLVLLVPLPRFALVRGPSAKGWVDRIIVGATCFLTLAGFTWWTVLSAGTTGAMGWERGAAQARTVQPGHQLHFVLTHPWAFVEIVTRTLTDFDWSYLISFLGQMGYALGYNLTTSVPGALCTLVALGIGLFHGGHGDAGRFRTTGLIAVWVLSVAAIFGTLYLAFAPLASYHIGGVQGRYFVPLALLGSAILVQVVPMRFADSARTLVRVERSVYVLCTAALAFAVLKYVLAVYAGGYPHLR